MQPYLDTANLAEIQKIASWGAPFGVTTHPRPIAKEGRVLAEVAARGPSDIATMPYAAFEQQEIGPKRFMEVWEKARL